MKAKLLPRMLDVLKAIDAGEPRPKGRTGTLSALWSRGLIVEGQVLGADGRQHWGWRLTLDGKLALRHGRQPRSI